MAKKKKKSQADFKKVKLKVGKVLKKTQQTDVSFKAKKVVLSEQLTHSQQDASDSGVLSYRKLPISTLCQQLGHHNRNVRKDALIGLKQVLSGSSSVIRSNLRLLVSALPRCVADTEASAEHRSLFRHLLQLIVESTSEVEMAPHFGVVVAHLTCAMTHLDAQVKMNAVASVEILLNSYPQLCRNDGNFLEGCLTMLGAVGSASFGQAGEVKMTKGKRRRELLAFLSHFLNVVLPKKEIDAEDTKSANKGVHLKLDLVGSLNETESLSNGWSIDLIDGNGRSADGDMGPFDVALFSDHSTPSSSAGDSTLLTRADRLRDCLDNCLPFLHNYWLELTSGNSREDSSTSFDANALTQLVELCKTTAQLLSAAAQQSSGTSSALYKSNLQPSHISSPFIKVGGQRFANSYANILPINAAFSSDGRLTKRLCGELNTEIESILQSYKCLV